MGSEDEHQATPRWSRFVETFEKVVVAGLTLLLVLIVTAILAVVVYIFARRLEEVVTHLEQISDVQETALRAFSGVLLVLLGLELLDTVKVYFQEREIRVEVILLVGLMAMGRHVLEIDLHHINPLTLFGFATLIMVLAVSYYLVKRADSVPYLVKLGKRGTTTKS